MKIRETVAAATNAVTMPMEFLVPIVAFVIPLVVAGPQWLTGTLVNALLFLAVTALSERTVWLVIVLPSLGAVGHGALFGPFTPFLLFFLPFIWLGNLLLVRAFTFLQRAVFPSVAVVMSAALKAALLFLCALLYVRLQWVPEPFLLAMGLVQFFTAVAGGFLALGIRRFCTIP